LRFARPKAHADHAALLDDVIKRPSAMLQQLTHQVSLLGYTLETNVFHHQDTIEIIKRNTQYSTERTTALLKAYV
jgi:hypothetical protein